MAAGAGRQRRLDASAAFVGGQLRANQELRRALLPAGETMNVLQGVAQVPSHVLAQR